MAEIDLIKVWLDNVDLSHSKSKSTRGGYRRDMERFCMYAGTTPQKIFDEYQTSDEKRFRQKYGMILKAWQSDLTAGSYTPSTVANHVIAVESFFKYSDLPLGFIPKARREVIYHNRDIRKEEIQQILAAARPRERAFYAFMAQSGLRPETISLLQLKDLPELDEGKVPCLVMVPKQKTKGKFGAYFTFIGEDALKYLKDYLATRADLTPESYLFAGANGKGCMGVSQPSHAFANTLETLSKSGKIVHQKRGNRKPSEIHLYNLRKYFRNQAGPAGTDNVNFWMGHRIGGSDDNYKSREGQEQIEKLRIIYAEKAMPLLRLESNTPTETEKTISAQAKELEELKVALATFQKQFLEMQKNLSELKKKVVES